MKKLYIQPSIEIDQIEEVDMIASTIDVKANGFEESTDAENNPTYGITQGGPGDGSDFAKKGYTNFSDDFVFELDM